MIIVVLIWITIGHSYWITALQHADGLVLLKKNLSEILFILGAMLICWILGPLTYLIYYIFNLFRPRTERERDLRRLENEHTQ